MIPRSKFAALMLALSALAAAGPALTTIQDVLYKADGKRFSGSLTISWNSFQAADNSTIVTQSTTVKVVDGVLRVQLAPTTTASPQVNYSVTYTSDGKVQFQETWSVPSSGQPLRIRDVRLAPSAATAPGAAGDTGNSAISEASVVGLIADLGARPLKGTGFAAGRTAIVDPTGMLSSATGADSDCVHVDGSAGPCGSSAPDLSFVDNEALTGIVDGANQIFGLSAVPEPVTSLTLYLNGVLQTVNQDFTLAGTTLQFLSAATPQPGDTLLASYRTSGADPNASPAFSGPQVLCSGSGSATSSQTLSNIGTCSIPAGILQTGDRVEVRFDAAHIGAGAAFAIEVDWGATVMLHRDGAALDTLVTGRGDAGIRAAGAQLSAQSWGAILPFAAVVLAGPDDYTGGIAISFQGSTLSPADSVSLTNFTVLRIP